jgi:hypothetical protein
MTGVSMGSFITFSGAGATSLGVTSGSPYYISYASPITGIQISQTMGGMTYDVNTVSSLTDVAYTISGGSGSGSVPTSGQVLTYGTAGSLSWETPTTTTQLSSLTDVQVTGAAGGDLFSYDSMSSKWKNIAKGSNGTSLTVDGSGNISWVAKADALTVAVDTPGVYDTGYFEGVLDTPAAWTKITIAGESYWMPLYQ